MDATFLDRAILALANGANLNGSRRDEEAAEIVQDALALATAREKLLVRCEAEDAQMGAPGFEVEAYEGELAVLRAEREQYLNADKLIDAERQKVDALDAKLAAVQAERDALRSELERHDCAAHVDVREQIATLTRERDEARAEVERLRAAAPTVQTVDAEAVVRRIEARYIGAARGDARDREYDALRVIVQEATRPVSVERVAEASYQEHRKRHVDLPSWETNAEVNREEWRYAARAALRAIGAQLAEPEPAAPVAPQAEPASAPRGEWTEEQREAAWDMHLRTRGYTIDCNAARDHICLALAHVAPLFAPEPAPRPPFVVDREAVAAAIWRLLPELRNAQKWAATDCAIIEIERQRAEGGSR